MLTTDAPPQGWGASLIYGNQTKLKQHDCWSEIEAEMTSNAKEIKAIYYGLLRFEQVIKKMRNQAILIRSDNTTAIEFSNRFTVQTMQMGRLYTDRGNKINDKQDLELRVTD
ncbi:MAG: hypothetical protein EZS28_031576 [Streblomastix strix]|uniref:Reverse transcriptase RNase H-like domain-containing protein n=1 Tax=Streblomastix strix TaxID=222440 RepID=A0A5J4UQC7_9EUKA|nr:MAG: hypothetical protein EZS28_031576 [Streblomastix strix]